mmetsp:Transcript_15299/g.41364  ORF Transcript_15299/g.41364 Transcript_15299/m.41364 type:complete len:321 (-) Transcript_15299:856-1818(-)
MAADNALGLLPLAHLHNAHTSLSCVPRPQHQVAPHVGGELLGCGARAHASQGLLGCCGPSGGEGGSQDLIGIHIIPATSSLCGARCQRPKAECSRPSEHGLDGQKGACQALRDRLCSPLRGHVMLHKGEAPGQRQALMHGRHTEGHAHAQGVHLLPHLEDEVSKSHALGADGVYHKHKHVCIDSNGPQPAREGIQHVHDRAAQPLGVHLVLLQVVDEDHRRGRSSFGPRQAKVQPHVFQCAGGVLGTQLKQFDRLVFWKAEAMEGPLQPNFCPQPVKELIQVEIVYVYGKAIDEHETCACRNELLRFCHGTAEAAVHLLP